MEEKNLINENKETTTEKKKSKGAILLRIFIVICVIVLAFFIVKRILYKEKIDLKALPSINVTHISKGSIAKKISVTGTILPNDTYFVPAKVAGDIKKIYVKNGDYVKKGDPICEIDASKEIEAARITYDSAKKSYNRMSNLYHAGDISQQSFETVKAQYDAAKLAYDTKVEYSVPVAVGDGVVENTDMIINTSVKVERVLCYITSKEAKEINFGVTERVLDGIKIGDAVIVEKDGKIYDGQISNVANLIDQATGLFKVKAIITSENNFASGVNAKVTFTYQKKNNIDILSNDVVYYENSEGFVYVVNNENIIEKKYITVGIENQLNTEIISGIDKNDKIVASWSSDLAPGAVVTIANEEKPEDIIVYEPKIEEVKTTVSEIYEKISTDSDILNDEKENEMEDKKDTKAEAK